MQREEMVLVLDGIVKKAQSAISDVDYARSYARSVTASNYCSCAKKSMRDVEKSLTGIIRDTNHSEDEIVVILDGSVVKVKKAMTDTDLARANDRSSATISYCGYARNSMRDVESTLKVLIRVMSPTREYEKVLDM